MSTNRPWLPWYPADIFADPKYLVLSRSAKLTYREMLDRCWMLKAVLPGDPRKLAAMAGMSQSDFDADWQEMQADKNDLCFIPHPEIKGAWTNKRILSEWRKAEEQAEKARANGKKGGRPPIEITAKKTEVVNLANPGQSYPHSHPHPESEIIKETPTEYCSELALTAPPSEPSSPVVASFKLIKKDGDYKITQDMVDGWQETFPAVDVLATLKYIRQWCDDNPGKRKTRKGARSFVTTWLGREQNRGGGMYRRGTGESSAPETDPERARILALYSKRG